MENNNAVITLEGENGEIVDMIVIEMAQYNGKKYVLLQNTDEKDEDSYIFRFREEMDYDSLEAINDERELSNVFDVFEKKISSYDNLN